MSKRTLVVIAAVTAVVIPVRADAQQLSERASRALAELRTSAVIDQARPATDGRAVRSVRGVLTAPSQQPTERIVRDLLAAHGALFGVHDADALVVRRVTDLGASRVVRLGQTVDGVPVVGADLTALIDREGRVRLVMQSLVEPVIVGDFLLEPRDAAEIAAPQTVRPAVEPDARHATAVYVQADEGLVSAYAVYFGRVPALLANVHTFVNAETGEIMGRFNRVYAENLGLAWLENPVVSGAEPEVVTLPVDLEGQDCIQDDAIPPVGVDGEPVPGDEVPRLCTDLVSARSCWDHHETITVEVPILGELALHTCTEYHMALPNDAPAGVEDPDDDIDNDFYYDDYAADLDYEYADDPASGQDVFAEPLALFHAMRMYDYFQAFDPSLFDELRGGQLLVAVNWRLPVDFYALAANLDMMEILAALGAATNPNGQLYPYDNAMFMPGGFLYGIIERPYHTIMLFQGTQRDFAYDSDVIYHELTHAVVDTVVDGIGLLISRRDEQGLHNLAYAMNEAYADFFATSRNGNSVQGEYATSGTGMSPRDLAARPRHTCPQRLVNEEHIDSAPYSEALWEVREPLDHARAEHAMFAALCTLPPNADFQDGAAATVAAIDTEIGEAEATAAAEVFAQYGYDDETECARVVELGDTPIQMLAPFGTRRETYTMAPYAPAIVQYRIEVPPGTRQIRLRYGQGFLIDPESILEGGAAVLGMLVKAGGEPITFSTTGEVTSNADDVVLADEQDPDLAQLRRLVYHRGGEVLEEGTWHIMVINSGPSPTAIGGLHVETSADPPDVGPDGDADGDSDGDGDGDIDADADADADADGDEDAEVETPDDGDDGGCDCRAAGAHPRMFRRLVLL
jgi:Zn-dependent metalloprotease